MLVCVPLLQVKTLNRRVVELMGFDKWIPVSGQTYSRKIDYQVTHSERAVRSKNDKKEMFFFVFCKIQTVPARKTMTFCCDETGDVNAAVRQ